MKGSVPTIVMIVALAIIAILVVPSGSISLSTKTKGDIREEIPKAVASQEVQQ